MPAFFIPARNSRHRTACFALYRALLRQVPAIQLPGDITTDWGPVNPIKDFIRRGFHRNRADTSPRLVVSALKNGYKFLDLLHKAHSPSSLEHASIIEFLRDRQASLLAESSGPPPPPPPSTAPKPGLIPLLTRISPSTTPDPPQPRTTPEPIYKAANRPLPLCKLKGSVRRVPVLDECNGIPFLRLGKPQSPVLSRVLRTKANRRQKRITTLLHLAEERMYDAELEDAWDNIIRELRAREGVILSKERGDMDGGNAFQDGVVEAVRDLQSSLNEEQVDMVARAKAMLRIVREEKELAEQEAAERTRQGK